MNSDKWQKVQELFEEALSKNAPERESFLGRVDIQTNRVTINAP